MSNEILLIPVGKDGVKGNAIVCSQRAIETCETIKNMIKTIRVPGTNDDDPIEIPNIDPFILEKVVQYCMHHENDISIVSGLEETTEKTEDNAQSVQNGTVEEEFKIPRRILPPVSEWDQSFLSPLRSNFRDLLRTAIAAHYLDCKPLLALTTRAIAQHILPIMENKHGEVFALFGFAPNVRFPKSVTDSVKQNFTWAPVPVAENKSK